MDEEAPVAGVPGSGGRPGPDGEHDGGGPPWRTATVVPRLPLAGSANQGEGLPEPVGVAVGLVVAVLLAEGLGELQSAGIRQVDEEGLGLPPLVGLALGAGALGVVSAQSTPGVQALGGTTVVGCTGTTGTSGAGTADVVSVGDMLGEGDAETGAPEESTWLPTGCGTGKVIFFSFASATFM